MLTLLNDNERNNLKKWSYQCNDESITTIYLSSFWNFVVKFVPIFVAPNILSLSGLLMLTYSFHISYNYMQSFPKLISFFCALLIFVYQTLDAIDGKHARNTKNSSPLGELFDHACDSVGMSFIILTMACTLKVFDTTSWYYITQTGLILFMLEHLDAFNSKVVDFSVYSGPGELLLVCISILLYQSISPKPIDLGFIKSIYFYWIYFASLIYALFKLFFSFLKRNGGVGKVKNPEYYATEFAIGLCLSMQFMNSVLLKINGNSWTLVDVLACSLSMSVLISDLIVAKMAQRELHPTIVLGMMLTIFNNHILTFVMIIAYFLRMFYEICDSMNIMLLSPSQNVYICGVFDLLHYGHMKHFEKAAELGNRLIVGVHSDKDVESYKRRPHLKMEERCTAASYCKLVSEVIPNAPLCMSKEFIEKHNIHIVGCSAEYDTEDDEYYKIPREMGILKVIDRVDGISTTELIKRVQN